MKILVIKMSSMGDLVHTMPAIIEAKYYINDLKVDWLVDDSFKDVLQLYNIHTDIGAHALVKSTINQPIIDNIFSIPLRKIKKNFTIKHSKKLFQILKEIKNKKYDIIIDAQGLLKSAIIAKLVKSTEICGFDSSCCRESAASLFYDHKIIVDNNLHAITRTRMLFAQSLNYCNVFNINKPIDFGINKKHFAPIAQLGTQGIKDYILFLHGTTWETKQWDLDCWQELAFLINNYCNRNKCNKYVTIIVMASNDREYYFAQELQKATKYQNNYQNKYKDQPKLKDKYQEDEPQARKQGQITILANLSIYQAATVVANAMAVVAVDTGLSHLAGAMGVPTIGIYGPSSVGKAGIMGDNYSTIYNIQAKYHCSPCFARVCKEYNKGASSIKQPCMRTITPKVVFDKLKLMLPDLL